jgi:hypothetical protein
MPEIKCPHCGNPIYDEEALLCLYCGNSLRRKIGFMGRIKNSSPQLIIILLVLIFIAAFLLLVIR